MKKWLQVVALLLTLTLSAQPVLADTACGQRSCGSRPTMECCPPPTAVSMPAMPMGMTCGQPQPMANGPMHCAGSTCCMLSPATVPAITTSNLPTPIAARFTTLPTTWGTSATLSAIKRPPGPRQVLPTARYILFRDFRI